MVYAAPLKREPESARGARPFAWVAEHWGAIDPALFFAFAGAAIAFVGAVFVRGMLQQTGGKWSAPLDDVLIHFDFARATARGYPLEWSEGNGYSSGETSPAYALVLALGYRIGFTGMRLVPFALGIAGASVLAYFAGASVVFAPLGRFAKYFLPPATLVLGALDWSLASGMENAFHLGVVGCLIAATRFAERSLEAPAMRTARRAWLFGLAAALAMLSRPESLTVIAPFATLLVLAAWSSRRGFPERRRFAAGLAARALLPAAFTAIGQGVANRVLTGSFAPAGAISKLVVTDPYLSGAEKLAAYRGNLAYAVGRLLHHHFADVPCTWRTPYAAIPVALALVPFFDRRVRRYAVALWASLVGWILVVAGNDQVRWQNERYLMAPAAWLLALAALGLGVLVSGFGDAVGQRARWGLRAAIAGVATLLFVDHQALRFREQTWFYARAARNILDQQLTTGAWDPRANTKVDHRIFVGDAGAITYAADLPGLDGIGLGGFHKLPFAAARRHGVGAVLELMEHLPDDARPDVMAIYPSWWDELPTSFGREEHEVTAPGNVICGASTKVVYRANWLALDATGTPRTLRDGETVVSEGSTLPISSPRKRWRIDRSTDASATSRSACSTIRRTRGTTSSMQAA